MSDAGHPPRRVTQRHIAEIAGVSQAVVSLVLNGKADATSRIPESTRLRVQEVIRATGYTADPAARRLAGVGNRIIGVFTYEPAFPSGAQDFYTPLLTGIEAEAERLGYDLLMFTSAPVVDGHRQLLHADNRLRLADGCLLLGLEMDGTELAALRDGGYPFVAVGRRDVDGVPYVGLDYVGATAALVGRAAELGHTRLLYLHLESQGESVLDRQRGFRAGAEDASVEATLRPVTGLVVDDAEWAAVRSSGATAVFVEEPDHAEALLARAARDGLAVPGDLSVVVLGEPHRPSPSAVDVTRLSPQRQQLGVESLRLLSRILDPGADITQDRLVLDCDIVDGTTLAAPRSG